MFDFALRRYLSKLLRSLFKLGILSDKEIIELGPEMLSNFQSSQVTTLDGQRCLSFGIAPYGYDLTCGQEFHIFDESTKVDVIDPLNFDPKSLKIVKAVIYNIPPGTHTLVQAVEHIKLPNDVMALCVGKSTYARAGVIVNPTVLWPGWEGDLVIELGNVNHSPVMVRAGQGIATLIFFRGKVPLALYSGKYQKQRNVTHCK